MAKKLFVGGLSWDTTDATLRDFFSQYGEVLSASVITDKFTGKSRGFGFVEMSNDADADKAVKEANGQSLDGRAITVNEARPREEGQGGGGRGFSRGGGDFNRGGDRGGRGGGGGRRSY